MRITGGLPVGRNVRCTADLLVQKRLHLMAKPQAAALTALKAARCKVTNSCTVIGR